MLSRKWAPLDHGRQGTTPVPPGERYQSCRSGLRLRDL